MTEVIYRAWNIPNKTMYHDVQNGVLAENENGQLVLGVTLGTLCKDAGYIVTRYIGVKDVNDKKIFIDDIIDVTVFFVSPQNPDEDISFRGVVIEHELKVCLKIYSFLNDSSGWKKLSETNNGFPFNLDYIEDDNTFIVSLFELCALSGNLGELLEDNLEVMGNVYQNPELLNN